MESQCQVIREQVINTCHQSNSCLKPSSWQSKRRNRWINTDLQTPSSTLCNRCTTSMSNMLKLSVISLSKNTFWCNQMSASTGSWHKTHSLLLEQENPIIGGLLWPCCPSYSSLHIWSLMLPWYNCATQGHQLKQETRVGPCHNAFPYSVHDSTEWDNEGKGNDQGSRCWLKIFYKGA